MYYISPSFRGEDPDSTHLNQFFHIECEMQGDMNVAVTTAEMYIVEITRSMLEEHASLIKHVAGSVDHITSLLETYDRSVGFPRVCLDQAIEMMPDQSCWEEYAVEGHPYLGRKLTRKGERHLIARYNGFVWLTEMDHLPVPFYQAYLPGSGKAKAKAGDLLMGLGETLGMGERHATAQEAADALDHHKTPRQSYGWYMDIRKIRVMQTSGWGMGGERNLCWLLQHDDVRDLALIPRFKGQKFLP